MTTILHISASARLDGSVSRAATARLIADLSPARVILRDLSAVPLPQIDPDWVAARLVPASDQSEADQRRLALSDTLVAEIIAADVLVFGVPLYNFGVPASLKAWIDLVARPKVTFAYEADGPVGLLEDKRAIVAVASGGVPVGSPADYATPHMITFLNFIGITDVTVHAAKDILAKGAP